MRFNKGQIGQTTTWVVGTIVILVVVFVFVYVAGIVGTAKSLTGFDFFGSSDSRVKEIGTQQTLFAFMNYNPSGRKVIDGIKVGDFTPVASLGAVMTNEDIRCSFYVYDAGIPRHVFDNGGDEEVILEIGDTEARLRC